MAIKNTIIVFDAGEGDIAFFSVEGDYRHLDRVWIGVVGDDKKEAELCNLLFDAETGEVKLPKVQDFPESDYSHNSTAVIVCGLVP